MYWLLIAASWNRGELLDVNPDGGLNVLSKTGLVKFEKS